jgi:hypothetical protein
MRTFLLWIFLAVGCVFAGVVAGAIGGLACAVFGGAIGAAIGGLKGAVVGGVACGAVWGPLVGLFAGWVCWPDLARPHKWFLGLSVGMGALAGASIVGAFCAPWIGVVFARK